MEITMKLSILHWLVLLLLLLLLILQLPPILLLRLMMVMVMVTVTATVTSRGRMIIWIGESKTVGMRMVVVIVHQGRIMIVVSFLAYDFFLNLNLLYNSLPSPCSCYNPWLPILPSFYYSYYSYTHI